MSQRFLEVELWARNGDRIADISSMAESRSVTGVLNGMGTFQFSLDYDVFQRYCRKIGVHPRTLLYPLKVEVVLKLAGNYWRSYDVIDVTPYFNETGATLSVYCADFLNRFAKRYITKSYSQVESTGVSTDMITMTQAQPNGDLGIAIGSQQYATGQPRDRNYERQNIKDELVNLTNLEDGHYDFRFTWDRKYETYAQLGALRWDVPLRYGDGGNILNVNTPYQGGDVANSILGLGEGFGQDQLTSSAEDEDSQINFMLREDLPQWNSVSVQSTLDEHTAGYLAAVKDVIRLPQPVVTSDTIDLTRTSEGDRFPLDLTKYDYTDDVQGLFRLQSFTANFDDQDFAEVALTFDDLGVDQDESPQ